ncbi:MAG TPA: high-potential iron-sulfur protein [Polyangiaceae bacterium]|nr:high-potential iron-sulfur protein [Polyangiaceae bacterium]
MANTISALDPPRLSRRSLLVRGASVVGLIGVAGCQKGPSFCNDVSGLAADQQNTRTTLGYEDTSDQPGKSCAKCSQYIAPPEMSRCGNCKVLAGTVHPNGYCRAFTPKA